MLSDDYILYGGNFNWEHQYMLMHRHAQFYSLQQDMRYRPDLVNNTCRPVEASSIKLAYEATEASQPIRASMRDEDWKRSKGCV